jgi:hypothetical protein
MASMELITPKSIYSFARTIGYMPSLKRDRLLSDLERERLETRSSLDRHTRATNDVRVKKKLSSWLKNTNDVLHIIEHLPEDQLNQIFEDEHAYRMLKLAGIIMDVRNFYPLKGKLENPEDWKIVISRSPGQNPNERPATDVDIDRAWILETFFDGMNTHFDTIGGKSPIRSGEFYFTLLEHPTLKEKVGPKEMRGLERILKAVEARKPPEA